MISNKNSELSVLAGRRAGDPEGAPRPERSDRSLPRKGRGTLDTLCQGDVGLLFSCQGEEPPPGVVPARVVPQQVLQGSTASSLTCLCSV